VDVNTVPVDAAVSEGECAAMAYVITQNCCKDASCVPVCPVDCIRPVGGAGEFTQTEMLYIDPQTCIDCGACMEECPVDAIHYEEDLPPELERFRDINAAYFEHHPLEADSTTRDVSHAAVTPGALRVAIVGAGPAACYAAGELLRVGGVEVDMFERLPTPFGLVRAGVAPDHQHTKSVVNLFESRFSSPRFACHLNVDIGRDLTHAELAAHHHAVIYAVGASASRDLGIPGEALVGSHAASDFVGWYNGHPDHADRTFDIGSERTVIIGNGNVALDAARVLLSETSELVKTDIAQHALDALAQSAIREVVIVARRGPRHAAFSVGEFWALAHLPGIDVIVDSDNLEPHPDDDVETRHKLEVAREFTGRVPDPANKRIVFRFCTSPTEVVGDSRTEGLRVRRPDGTSEVIETSLVLRAISYRGSPVQGLPFDSAVGIIPNTDGRVLELDGAPSVGVYVTGWIKRGPRGVIGANRTCAQETVLKLWQDFDAGLLDCTVADRETLFDVLDERGARKVTWQGWRAIDASERKRGAEASRPRVKYVGVEEMLRVATQDISAGR
jgi:ferredoxin/flavodoxin---NADP+ reductase